MELESLKEKRANLLNCFIQEIQNTIKQSNHLGEDKRKIGIYSRIAEYTYYSEVSIRKFLTGAIPKNVATFVEGMIAYGNYIHMDKVYLEKFSKEYISACSLIEIDKYKRINNKNNLGRQDLSEIVRTENFTNNMDSFMQQEGKIAYIYGYKLSGKTKSTMAYVYDYMNQNAKFEYILWVNYHTKGELKLDVINGMFELCEMFESYQSFNMTVKETEFFRFLKEHECLLIVDLNDEILEEKQWAFFDHIAKYSKLILISSISIDQYSMEWKEKLLGISLNQGFNRNDVKKMLYLDPFLKELAEKDTWIIEKLYTLTSGFPFAIRYFSNRLMEANRYGVDIQESLNQYTVIEASTYEELNQSILGSIWEKLSVNTKNILMICSIFSYSISFKLLSYVSGLELNSNEWIKVLNECYKYGLLNHLFFSHPRCYMHSFIRILIYHNLMKEKDLMKQFLNKVAEYYIQICSNIGESYNDLEKFKMIDEYDEYHIISEVLEQLYQKKEYEKFIMIDVNLKYYTYVRGYWNIGEKSRRLKRAKAAHILKDYNAELEAYCDYINIMSKSRNEKEASRYIEESNKLIIEYGIDKFNKRILALWNHVKALYLYHCKEQYEEAFQLWKQNEMWYEKDMNEYRKLVNLLWMDKSKYHLSSNLEQLYKEVTRHYQICIKLNFTRGMIDYLFILSNILLKGYHLDFDNSRLEKVEEFLKEVRSMLEEKNKWDIRNEAEYYRIATIVGILKKEEWKSYYHKAVQMYQLLNAEEDIKKLDFYLSKISDEK